MPRPPKTDSNKYLLFQARNQEEEVWIKAFKEICIRNNKTLREEGLRLVHDYFLVKEHRWPPGNSQTLLESFPIVTVEEPSSCAWCDHEAEAEIEYIPSGQVYPVCAEHLEQSRGESKWKETKR